MTLVAQAGFSRFEGMFLKGFLPTSKRDTSLRPCDWGSHIDLFHNVRPGGGSSTERLDDLSYGVANVCVSARSL